MRKSKVKITRKLYPKGGHFAGDFAIVAVSLVEHMEGERPKLHKLYNNFSLVGPMPSFEIGDEFIVCYDNEEERNGSYSYKLLHMTLGLDLENPDMLFTFLQKTAGQSVAREMMKVPNILELLKTQNDKELLKIKGIGEKKLLTIYKNMDTKTDNVIAYAELGKHGITHNLIDKICKTFSSPVTAVQLVKKNPYILVTKVNGIGFKKADEIALSIGFDMNSPERIKAAIFHVMETEAQAGKTYLTAQQLLGELSNLLSIDKGIIVNCIKELQKEKIVFVNKKGKEFGLTKYLELEKNIANEIKRIKNSKSKIDIPDNWKDIIEQIEQKQGWKYTDEQFSAIEQVLFENISVVTGYAGTGKTTVVNAMTKILDGYLIKQCALAAKAAQRMQEVTGIESSTIHRLLGIGKIDNDEMAEKEQDTLPIDVVILDESSMVNGELFLQLLKAIPSGSKLIILGDTGQLQAIGSCAVLADIINCNYIKSTQLTKIHRQAAASAIISKSIDIRHQKPIYETGFKGERTLGDLQDLDLFIYQKELLQDKVLQSFDKSMMLLDNIMEVQIVTPMKQRGDICTDKLNKIIQSKYTTTIGAKYESKRNNCSIFVGDKVINLKNNYETFSPTGEKRPIANGNMGIVRQITENSIIIDFQNQGEVEVEGEARENINLAYAITIHSSQGSQFEHTIVAIDSASYIMGNVEILYTGITRAQKHCYLVAEPGIISKCLKTVENQQKQTYLCKILNSFSNPS